MYKKTLILSSAILAPVTSLTALQTTIQSENQTLPKFANEIKQNNYDDQGVTKVETKWYYFASYFDVYISNYWTNQLKNVFEQKDGMAAVFFLADLMGDLGYGGYKALLLFPATTFGLASNIALRKPWQKNVGYGIQWDQGAFGTIGDIWTQTP